MVKPSRLRRRALRAAIFERSDELIPSTELDSPDAVPSDLSADREAFLIGVYELQAAIASAATWEDSDEGRHRRREVLSCAAQLHEASKARHLPATSRRLAAIQAALAEWQSQGA